MLFVIFDYPDSTVIIIRLMENINLLLALGGGIAAFISPCILPIIPVYFVALVGPEFLDLSKSTSLKRSGFFCIP